MLYTCYNTNSDKRVQNDGRLFKKKNVTYKDNLLVTTSELVPYM